MEGLLAMMEQQPLQAGSHVDEKDPWLAFPELYQEVFDTVSGQTLLPDLLAVARKEEMEFLSKLQAYELVTIAECYEKTNKRPIPVGWVDVNKGDQRKPAVRSRLVVKEAKRNSDLTDPAVTPEIRFHVPHRMRACDC
eukprot:6491521-Amphidinium_carterae.2